MYIDEHVTRRITYAFYIAQRVGNCAAILAAPIWQIERWYRASFVVRYTMPVGACFVPWQTYSSFWLKL
ncbi:hypothetical protein PHLGIDRAFT_483089 [Phlebiopsis gigantea 11061_1 CR5-6]|uniref:Uncharacterized protein n=1 Tax=Phlebiopsis gigantea (strain 11061_1 CR5-6) TaxID=745531 RepID=A0A0C3PIL5_PHLG1|nr:hypothetical protein PHLGIDRAFT_483089 [Phlebiopsis gigantea 11061_1 CR5-6]